MKNITTEELAAKIESLAVWEAECVNYAGELALLRKEMNSNGKTVVILSIKGRDIGYLYTGNALDIAMLLGAKEIAIETEAEAYFQFHRYPETPEYAKSALDKCKED